MIKLATIAGSDASGGAGLEADLKTFQEYGGYGMAAITLIGDMKYSRSPKIPLEHSLKPFLPVSELMRQKRECWQLPTQSNWLPSILVNIR